MPENPTNLLGPLIRQYRERYGMSLVEMAKLSGLSPSTILRIEQNKVAPSKQAINNIARLMLKTLQTSKLNDDVISKKIHSYTILENFSIDEREKYRRSYKNPDASMREVAAFLLSQERIQSIPKQGISVHFAVEAGQIKTIPTQYFGEDENDYLSAHVAERSGGAELGAADDASRSPRAVTPGIYQRQSLWPD